MFKTDENLDITFEDAHRTFKVAQVHFHWGGAVVNGKTVDSVGGSEHTVNGAHYPIEVIYACCLSKII